VWACSDVSRNPKARFDAAWEIDLFGFLRNPSRAIVKRTEAEAAALRAMRLSMVAETAQAYFALQGARQRLALARDNVTAADEVLRVVDLLADAGRLNGVDAARAKAQRDSLAAALPARDAEQVAQEQRLAVLTALPVAEVRDIVGEQARLPALPALVATGTPEQWLKRRPDIVAAERQLSAAYNDVGEEVAQFFPRLVLNGAAIQDTHDLLTTHKPGHPHISRLSRDPSPPPSRQMMGVPHSGSFISGVVGSGSLQGGLWGAFSADYSIP